MVARTCVLRYCAHRRCLLRAAHYNAPPAVLAADWYASSVGDTFLTTVIGYSEYYLLLPSQVSIIAAYHLPDLYITYSYTFFLYRPFWRLL
jgi:hypothetical protein